jgi:hypothetical protein
MPANNQTRARLNRSISTEGTEAQQDALSYISDNLTSIVKSLTALAKRGDVQAAKALIALQQEEFIRAKSGANDPLLVRLQEIREAGSPKIRQLWGTLYKNTPRIEARQ